MCLLLAPRRTKVKSSKCLRKLFHPFSCMFWQCFMLSESRHYQGTLLFQLLLVFFSLSRHYKRSVQSFVLWQDLFFSAAVKPHLNSFSRLCYVRALCVYKLWLFISKHIRPQFVSVSIIEAILHSMQLVSLFKQRDTISDVVVPIFLSNWW